MSYTNKKITAPVSIYDLMQAVPVILQRTVNGVQQTITSSDLGTIIKAEVGDTIPASDGLGSWTVVSRVKINMWAMFKPVILDLSQAPPYTRINTIVSDEINMTTKEWKRNASKQWWRDTFLSKYGLIPIVGGSMKNLYLSYANDWSYSKPPGINNEYYRISDFNEYWHDAPQPSGRVAADSYVVVTDSVDGGWSVNCALLSMEEDAGPVASRDYVVPEDILKEYWGVNEVYFGFALFDQTQADPNNPEPILWVTGTRYTGVGTTYLKKGKYYNVMPFYSSKEIPEDFSTFITGVPGDVSGAKFARIPLLPSMPVLQTAPAGQVNPKARYLLKATLRNGVVTVTATITAEADGTTTYTGGTFTNVHVLVTKQTYDPSQVAQAGDIIQDWDKGTVTVAAGSKWVGPGNNIGGTVSTSEDRVMCYLMENGVRRAMANAIVSQDVTPSL